MKKKNFKWHNQLYSLEVIKDIHKRLQQEIDLIEQWSEYVDWTDRKLEHLIKAEALLELLENIVVFNTGLGYKQDCQLFNNRVKSFNFIPKL